MLTHICFSLYAQPEIGIKSLDMQIHDEATSHKRLTLKILGKLELVWLGRFLFL